ncbi:hypothetical protein AGMMS4956_05310 [Bacteroidia bacterium]|nr:hypothetical protein AGMMS4956_05310 [Bacteroidia bacterium]
MLQTITLAERTLVLLKQLQQLPVLKDFRLVGGTALALQLGHRKSIDLDFFGNTSVSHEEIFNILQKNNFEVVSNKDTPHIHLFTINAVKVDVVVLSYQWLEPAIEEDGIRMAGLKDIAAMKLAAITNRGSKKDFVDVYFLLQHFSLKQMVDWYMQKYPKHALFNVIQSINYFADAEPQEMPTMLTEVSWEDMKSTIQKEVTIFQRMF